MLCFSMKFGIIYCCLSLGFVEKKCCYQLFTTSHNSDNSAFLICPYLTKLGLVEFILPPHFLIWTKMKSDAIIDIYSCMTLARTFNDR